MFSRYVTIPVNTVELTIDAYCIHYLHTFVLSPFVYHFDSYRKSRCFNSFEGMWEYESGLARSVDLLLGSLSLRKKPLHERDENLQPNPISSRSICNKGKYRRLEVGNTVWKKRLTLNTTLWKYTNKSDLWLFYSRVYPAIPLSVTWRLGRASEKAILWKLNLWIGRGDIQNEDIRLLPFLLPEFTLSLSDQAYNEAGSSRFLRVPSCAYSHRRDRLQMILSLVAYPRRQLSTMDYWWNVQRICQCHPIDGILLWEENWEKSGF